MRCRLRLSGRRVPLPRARAPGDARMQYRRRLRSRIIISFLLFGIGLTGAVRGHHARHARVARGRADRDHAAARGRQDRRAHARDPDAGAPRAVPDRAGLDLRRATASPKCRSSGASSTPGVYDIEERVEAGEQRVLQARGATSPTTYWLFLRYDVTEQRRTRNVLLVALVGAVGVFAALSLAVAIWLSARVLRPVTDLARASRAFERARSPSRSRRISRTDEVGAARRGARRLRAAPHRAGRARPRVQRRRQPRAAHAAVGDPRRHRAAARAGRPAETARASACAASSAPRASRPS